MPRSEDTTTALIPPKLNLTTELKEVTSEVEGFKASAVSSAFLSGAAVQENLKPGFDNFISDIKCIEYDFLGEAASLEIMIDDTKSAAAERGSMPPARVITLKAAVEGTPEVVQSLQLKLNQNYE